MTSNKDLQVELNQGRWGCVAYAVTVCLLVHSSLTEIVFINHHTLWSTFTFTQPVCISAVPTWTQNSNCAWWRLHSLCAEDLTCIHLHSAHRLFEPVNKTELVISWSLSWLFPYRLQLPFLWIKSYCEQRKMNSQLHWIRSIAGSIPGSLNLFKMSLSKIRNLKWLNVCVGELTNIKSSLDRKCCICPTIRYECIGECDTCCKGRTRKALFKVNLPEITMQCGVTVCAAAATHYKTTQGMKVFATWLKPIF